MYVENIIDIEREYFRHTKIRLDGPGVLKITSDIPDITHSAYFHIDKNWSGVREQIQERYLKIWATPEEGWQVPDRSIMQGLLSANGWTQSQAASKLGISIQNFKKWLQHKHAMPFTAWYTLLLLND